MKNEVMGEIGELFWILHVMDGVAHQRTQDVGEMSSSIVVVASVSGDYGTEWCIRLVALWLTEESRAARTG